MLDRAEDDRGRVALAAVLGQGADVLHLGIGAVRVEVGVADDLVVDQHAEEAGRHPLTDQSLCLKELFDHLRFRPGVALHQPPACGPQRLLLQLSYEREVGLFFRLAQLCHHEMPIDPPTVLDEPRCEPVAEVGVGNENQAALEPLCLGDELSRIGVSLDPEVIAVRAFRHLVGVDRPAVWGSGSTASAHVSPREERVGAGKVVTHRRGAAGGRASRARRCRGGRRARSSSPRRPAASGRAGAVGRGDRCG